MRQLAALSLMVICVLSIASHASGQQVGTLRCLDALQPAYAATDSPGELGALIAAVRNARVTSSARQVRPQVISVEAPSSSLLIPAAGNLAGGGGTYFRSDVTLANYRTADQRVAIGWLQAGQDNTNQAVQYFTLPALTTTAIQDFVNVSLHKTGLGAIVVISVDSQGNTDTSGNIDGYSRIWTPQPGSAGTVSQNFTSISLQDSIGSLTANALGLRQDSGFRVGAGVVNLDSVPHSWTIRSIATGAATTLTVPAYSLVQTTLPNGFGSPAGNVSLTFNSDGSGFWWSAYASSTDNVTGDGWVSRATQ
jgi:hypothetical protein